jgi:hypothetical protein
MAPKKPLSIHNEADVEIFLRQWPAWMRPKLERNIERAMCLQASKCDAGHIPQLSADIRSCPQTSADVHGKSNV